MTDRMTVYDGDPDRVPSGGGTDKVHSEHTEIAQTLYDFIVDVIEAHVPTMGTVTGFDGGGVRFQADDEESPREIPVMRKSGQRFRKGDRVLVQKTRSGRDVVVGTFTDSPARDQQGVVGNDDLVPRTIDYDSLRGEIETRITKAIQPSQVKGGEGAIKDNNKIVLEDDLATRVGYGDVKGGSDALRQHKIPTTDDLTGMITDRDVSGGADALKNNKIATMKDIPPEPDLDGYATIKQLNDVIRKFSGASIDVAVDANGEDTIKLPSMAEFKEPH